jgi:hypothetical protein
MRTEIEALKEIRDRISYFCARLDGKYDPPWAQEVIGIIDDVLITPYRQCKRFGAPFYVEVGTSIVAIRCASNHDVVWRADHSVHGKATVDWAESVCTRMNQEAHRRELSKNVSKNGADFGQLGDAAKLREALIEIRDICQRVGAAISPLSKRYKSQECRAVNQCFRNAVATLAEPPRNCDVGTMKEQLVRYTKFCYAHRSHEKGCGGCPLCGEPCCELAWAQMPYESGAAK